MTPPDIEELWRRMGLEELRKSLAEIKLLAHNFEEALRDLPPCDADATVVLVEHIKKAGTELGGKATSLATLAGTLKFAVTEGEKAKDAL